VSRRWAPLALEFPRPCYRNPPARLLAAPSRRHARAAAAAAAARIQAPRKSNDSKVNPQPHFLSALIHVRRPSIAKERMLKKEPDQHSFSQVLGGTFAEKYIKRSHDI
jgi:hypothetical protein